MTYGDVLRAMLRPFTSEDVPNGVLPRIDFIAARLGVAPPTGPSIREKLEELYPLARHAYVLPQYVFEGGVVYELEWEADDEAAP